MGTKLQSNTYVPQYYTVTDTNSVYPDDRMVKNGLYQHSPLSGKSYSGYLKHDVEVVRQTILRQESIFRNQLQELHRLYKRQRDLMDEIRLGGIDRACTEVENSRFSSIFSHVPHSSTCHSLIGRLPMSSPGPSRLSFIAGSGMSVCPYTHDTGSLNIIEPVMCKTMFKERTFDLGTSVSNSMGNIGNFKSFLAETRKEFSTHCPPDWQKSAARRKNTLFGVEISDRRDDELDAASNMLSQSQSQNMGLVNSESLYALLWTKTCSTFGQKERSLQENEKSRSNSKELDGCFSIGLDPIKSTNQLEIEHEIPEEKLPWFLRKPQEGKNSYFMNLDSLQDYSHQFFSKNKVANNSPLPVNEKDQTSSEMVVEDSVEKVSKDKAVSKDLNNYFTGLRHNFDLNSSLDEEDAPLAPTLPPAVIKIATTEIDLASPAAECVEEAAKAIIDISQSGKNFLADDCTNELLETSLTDLLKWLAEITISDCVDDFEFMTLRLKDTKDEYYNYKRMVAYNKEDEETRAAMSHKRPRRGQARKGRHDFQRDILPGLVTLSRHEVNEDLQTFEEVLKAQGCSLESRLSTRNATKGRRKRANVSPTKKVVDSTLTEVSFCHEMGLSGWGKRAKKRLPRRRCGNAHLKRSLQFGNVMD